MPIASPRLEESRELLVMRARELELARRGLVKPGERPGAKRYQKYQSDPVGYAEEVLGVSWWSKQQEIARALLQHRRVMCLASHMVGKSHVAAGLINFHYDCFNPGLTLSTAPSLASVKEVLWKEVRVQRKGRPGLAPAAPWMRDADDHWAAGYTARDDSSFQGRHDEHVLIIFDEAIGIEGPFWDAATGMMNGPETYFLAIMNPTDTTSRAYQEYIQGGWHTIEISALDHPNVIAECSGLPPEFPSAVRKQWVDERVTEWCTPILASDKTVEDIEWPLGTGNWHRPGPVAESRLLGRWPTAASRSVWTQALWSAALTEQPVPQDPLKIGADIARFGDDFSSFVVRRGPCVLHHETHNGWSTAQTAGRLKQLAREYSELGEEPKSVEILIDDSGVGGGVTDQKDGIDGPYNFVGLNSGEKSLNPEDYPNRRSELWFNTAERARHGMLDLSRLLPASRALLQRQVMAPLWTLDAMGRRVVEPKDKTKHRIGRSPDDADALNLAFATAAQRRVLYSFISAAKHYEREAEILEARRKTAETPEAVTA